MLLAIGTVAVAFLSTLMLIWLDDRITDQDYRPGPAISRKTARLCVSLARSHRLRAIQKTRQSRFHITH